MVNHVTLVGRVTKDIRVAGTKEKPVINLTLATNRKFKNKEGEYDADFPSIVAFGNSAKTILNYTAKGSLIAIEGRLQTRSYDKDGQRVYVTEVVAEQVSLLESKEQTEARKASQPAEEAPVAKATDTDAAPGNDEPVEAPVVEEVEDDDLPF